MQLSTLARHIGAHAIVYWPVVFLYAVAVTLPHEWVQGVLGQYVVPPLGQQGFYASLGVGALTGMGWAGWSLRAQLPQTGTALREHLGWLGIATGVLTLLTWQLFSVNNSELVHLVQYAVPGFVLMSLTRNLAGALAWIVLLGGADEAYQYAILHPGWGIPFDFNDVYLDLMGGAIGAVLAAASLPAVPRKAPAWNWVFAQPGIVLLASIAAAVAIAVLTGKVAVYDDQSDPRYWFALSRLYPKGFWFFDATWGPRRIHVLAPWEGPALIAATLALYATLDRRFRFHSLSASAGGPRLQ